MYAILDVGLCEARDLPPTRVLHAWLDAGVRLVQLRAKGLSLGPCLRLADEMAAECRRAGAIFIVNDRIDVGRLSGADGVHLGQTDLTPEDARAAWPEVAWIGLSTHNDEQIAGAVESAAHYIAIGPVFATSTKTNPDPVVGIDGVRRASALVRHDGRPLVAIGGIDLDAVASVLEAGADSVAIASGLLGGTDLTARARAFLTAAGSI